MHLGFSQIAPVSYASTPAYIQNAQQMVTRGCLLDTSTDTVNLAVREQLKSGKALNFLVMTQMPTIGVLASTDPTLSVLINSAAATSASVGVEDRFITNIIYEAPEGKTPEPLGKSQSSSSVQLGSPVKQSAPPSVASACGYVASG